MIESFVSSGTGLGTAATYGLKKTSPFSNGLGVLSNYAIVSGSTRIDLVPYSLQNLTPFNGVYVEGASSISEIYPFSAWPGLRQFQVKNSSMDDFSVTLPEKIGYDTNAFLYFISNRKLTKFSPKYSNPELYNGYVLSFTSNNFLGTQTEPFGIDLSKKNYWGLSVYGNTNLYSLKISGNSLNRERNTLNIGIERNPLLTDIIFDPPNSFTAMSVATSATCYTCTYDTGGFKPNYNNGDLRIFLNAKLSGLTSPLPDTSGIYTAIITNNNFINWNSPFIHGNPVYLDLQQNKMSRIHPTFSGWPLSVAKKYNSLITGDTSFNPIRGIVPPGLKFNSFESGTKNDSVYLSGNVSTITVGADGRSVSFQLTSTDKRLAVLYLQRNSWNSTIFPDQPYPDWGWTDIGRIWSGFDFTCDENEPQNIQQFFGRYKNGLWGYNTVNGGLLNFSAFSSTYITPGTYTPTNGILYYPVDSWVNLANNNFSSFKDTNNNEVPVLPNGLSKISFDSSPNMTSFNTNLNRHLDYFSIGGCGFFTTFNGEVSGATRLCYFNISYTILSSWDKQFYTGATQYGQISRTNSISESYFQIPDQTYLPELPSWMQGWLKKGFDFNNTISSAQFPNYYNPIHRFFTNADTRHIYNRVAYFNNTWLTNLNLFLLYPFTHIYLNNTRLTNLSNFHQHPNLKLIDLTDTKFTNSNSIIGDSNPWPPNLKYYLHANNNISSPGTLSTWTKSFSGLTSSTGYTFSETDPTGPPYSAWNLNLNKQRLFLDFRGNKSLTGESGFDFIVRDLVTAKTFGTYLSGGVLMVSGVSASTSSSYEVNNVLSPWPTKNTGFTTINGSQFVVSNYGYMSDWLNLLTGTTIGETTGRGWIVDVGRFYVFQSVWQQLQLSNFPVPNNCNIVTNGKFTNDASSWIYSTSDWDWSSNNNGSMILTNGNNASLGGTLLQNNIVNSSKNYKLALTLIIDSSWSGSLNISISMGGTNIYSYNFTTTGNHYLVEDVSSLTNSQGFLSIRYFNTGNPNLIYLKDVVLCPKF